MSVPHNAKHWSSPTQEASFVQVEMAWAQALWRAHWAQLSQFCCVSQVVDEPASPPSTLLSAVSSGWSMSQPRIDHAVTRAAK
jgi:hypothetical protein